MGKASLYTNVNGWDVTRHSYSGGETFRYCPTKYKLEKIEGWKEKGQKASREFGNCIEAAVQAYHTQEQDPVLYFSDKWNEHKEKDFIFTDAEKDWTTMLNMGIDMMHLYQIVKLPIVNPKFQLNYEKEVFPNSKLAGIKFTAYIDILCDGPMIVDCKTSGVVLPTYPENIISLDPQLRTYAWATGIPNVAFLNFIKKAPSIKSGDIVTDLTTGKEVEWTKGLSGVYTKQRVQFVRGYVSPEAQQDAAKLIAHDILAIVQAKEDRFYPKTGGIRFPNNKCMSCPMRGNCLTDPELRDTLVERIDASTEEFK